MRKIVYLPTFLPRSEQRNLAANMKNFNFNSADAFSYSIFCGLSDVVGSEMECINIPPLGAYPRFNRKSCYKGSVEEDNGIVVKSIGYSTLYVYQYISIYKNVLKALRKEQYTEPIDMVVYSINIPVLKAAIKYRRDYSPQSKIIMIVPDLIEYSLEESVASKIKTAIIGDMNQLYREVDGFVFLTEAMNERVKTKHPYCVVEGIYNSKEVRKVVKPNDGLKRIFYSGMLYEKFGVKTLVDAFLRTTDKKYRLQLCGVGELEAYIQEVAQKDTRIEYYGLVPREKALTMQSEASLLVNPRTPEGEFTKYSFPSKNIEYLASGTPALLYELDGIPSEYYQFCFHLSNKELGSDILFRRIDQILAMPEESLNEMAMKAGHFITDNKNSRTQATKIVTLIRSL